jgi:hypothetical protein
MWQFLVPTSVRILCVLMPPHVAIRFLEEGGSDRSTQNMPSRGHAPVSPRPIERRGWFRRAIWEGLDREECSDRPTRDDRTRS